MNDEDGALRVEEFEGGVQDRRERFLETRPRVRLAHKRRDHHRLGSKRLLALREIPGEHSRHQHERRPHHQLPGFSAADDRVHEQQENGCASRQHRFDETPVKCGRQKREEEQHEERTRCCARRGRGHGGSDAQIDDMHRDGVGSRSVAFDLNPNQRDERDDDVRGEHHVSKSGRRVSQASRNS